MGAFASELGKMDTVLPFVVKVCIVQSSAFYYNESDSPARWTKIILNRFYHNKKR